MIQHLSRFEIMKRKEMFRSRLGTGQPSPRVLVRIIIITITIIFFFSIGEIFSHIMKWKTCELYPIYNWKLQNIIHISNTIAKQGLFSEFDITIHYVHRDDRNSCFRHSLSWLLKLISIRIIIKISKNLVSD